MKYKKKVNKGFTLLEILLVIATIGILAAIVLVAINPNRQLAQVRNAQRRSDINTIYKALEQYLIDTGNYPNSVNSNFKEICNTGTEQVGGATDCSGKADLRVLVPTYLAAIPSDPSGGIYRVSINGNNKIAVYTVGENNQIIAINFAITNFGIIDVDALNYITAVETADGQALEDNIKIAINDFIMGLKTDNIWEPIKASVIMAGAKTLNGALVPLKGHAPTNFNFVAGDYNRKTGLVGDGSTKYLNSNRNNNVDPQNSRHLAVFVNTKGTAGNTFYIGTVFGEGNSFIVIRNNTDLAHRLSGTGADIPGIHGTGFIGINRNSSTFVIGRGNQNSVSVTTNSTTPNSNQISIFAGTSNFSPSASRIAFYSIGESLDLALLDARVTQLMTDLGNAIP